MKACASINAGYQSIAVKVSVELSACADISSSSSKEGKSKSDSTRIIAIGSKPKRDGEGKI